MKSPKWLLISASCLFPTVAIATNFGIAEQIKEYSGDGVIQNCSILFSPGYRVEFPKFDASRHYQATYRFSHLPQTGRELSGIILRFYQPDFISARKQKNSSTGRFSLAIRSNSKVVHSTQLRLSECFWGEAKGLFGIFSPQQSYFRFEPKTSYSLTVTYDPGKAPPPAKHVYFSIENGCSK